MLPRRARTGPRLREDSSLPAQAESVLQAAAGASSGAFLREEEVVLSAVQEEVLSESKEKSQNSQGRPKRRMGRRSKRWRDSGGGAVVL
jgi:hypothetical protein